MILLPSFMVYGGGTKVNPILILRLQYDDTPVHQITKEKEFWVCVFFFC